MARLDLLLVELGLARSRAQAQQLIKSGAVEIDGRVISKTSHETPHGSKITIAENSLTQFVSRGGAKLAGALERTKLDVSGLTVLDIGISTGGFADCLLQKGAAKVVGVDVGHGQLDSKLKNDSRVVEFEGVNARELKPSSVHGHMPKAGFPLIVADVSFISLELILPSAVTLLTLDGKVLALVKPQFEAGREYLGKTGVVSDTKAFEEVREKIYKTCLGLQLQVEDYFESEIPGTDGNQEYFVLASFERVRRNPKEADSP